MHGFNTPLVTLKSYKSSIETDKHVFRWFLYLILQPKAKAEVDEMDQMKAVYQKLTVQVMLYRIGLVCCLILSIYTIWWKNLFGLIPLAPLAFFLVMGNRNIRKYVSEIGVALTFKHFDEKTFPHKSLYQIGEALSRQYEVESMVEAIASVDNMMRRIMIFTVIAILVIHPLELWSGLLCLFVVYQLSYMFLNVTMVYRNLIK